jgi:hypothetical protein
MRPSSSECPIASEGSPAYSHCWVVTSCEPERAELLAFRGSPQVIGPTFWYARRKAAASDTRQCCLVG